MIQELRSHVGRFDARRAVGLLLVVALLLLAFAGTAHVLSAHPDAHGDHGCSVCFASLATAAASLPPPAPVALVAPTLGVPFRARAQSAPLPSDLPLAHAPRGPPAAA